MQIRIPYRTLTRNPFDITEVKADPLTNHHIISEQQKARTDLGNAFSRSVQKILSLDIFQNIKRQ